MKKKEKQLLTGRRDAIKMFGLGSAAIFSGSLGNISSAQAQVQENIQKPPQGLAPIMIKSVKAIGTKPGGSNLVVVKVETTEPVMCHQSDIRLRLIWTWHAGISDYRKVAEFSQMHCGRYSLDVVPKKMVIFM
jgi:hypothetical protein